VFLDNGIIKGGAGSLDAGFIDTVENLIAVLPERPCKRMGCFEDLVDSMRRRAVRAK
jgi:hypothetical protein